MNDTTPETLTPAERKLLEEHRASVDVATEATPDGLKKTVRWLLEEGFAFEVVTDATSKKPVGLVMDLQARFLQVRAGDLVAVLRRKGVPLERFPGLVEGILNPIPGTASISILGVDGPDAPMCDAALFPEPKS